MDERKNLIRRAIRPGIIVAALLIGVYLLKGVWPFGTSRVDYFDNMQQVAPVYTHLWDTMHGKANLFFDWYTGLGTSVSMTISAFSLISPFNLTFYLVPRGLLLEWIAYLNVIKLVTAAITMYLFLNYAFSKMGYLQRTVFSVLFALCGYSIMYAPVFTPWMDIVALFPLLMWALLKLLKERKKAFFIIMTASLFIINYYLAAMIMVYCVLFAGLYLLFITEKGGKLKRTFDLIISTITGIGLSAFILVPVFMNLADSQRSAESPGLKSSYPDIIFTNLLTESYLSFFQRIMMFSGAAIVIALVVVALIRAWKKKEKDSIFYTALTIIALLPVFVQGVAVVWHFGSYFGYTLRMGFLVAFTIIFVAGRYSSDRDSLLESGDIKRDKKPFIIAAIVSAAGACLYIFLFERMTWRLNMNLIPIFIATCMIVGMAVVYIIRISRASERGKGFNLLIALPFVFAEIFVGIYTFAGAPAFYKAQPFQNGDYVQTANYIKEDLNIEESVTDRIKNSDLSLNANYPFILRRSALSSFTAAITDGTQRAASAFGYSQYFTWMLDSGGTAFSDALLSVSQDVAIADKDAKLEKNKASWLGYSLYDMKYRLPFVLTFSNVETLREDLKKVQAFGREETSELAANDLTDTKNFPVRIVDEWKYSQNVFYKALGGQGNIIDNVVCKDLNVNDNTFKKMPDGSKIYGYISCNAIIPGKDESTLYLALKSQGQEFEDVSLTDLNKSATIYVNGEKVKISTIGDARTTIGPDDFNNNLISLGTFKGGESVKVEITFFSRKGIKDAEISLGALNLKKLDDICLRYNKLYEDNKTQISNDNKSMTITLSNTSKENYAVVPLITSSDMKVTINGKNIDLKNASLAGLFTALPLEEGENTIVISYSPRGVKLGLLATLIILAAFITIWIIRRKKICNPPKWILIISGIIFFAVFAGVVIGLLVIPTITQIPSYIKFF